MRTTDLKKLKDLETKAAILDQEIREKSEELFDFYVRIADLTKKLKR